MLGANYPTKKACKESIGKSPRFIETSLFGLEYKGDGKYTVVGPDPYRNRKWYAQVVVKNGLIAKVS
jgi:hypothetical protein